LKSMSGDALRFDDVGIKKAPGRSTTPSCSQKDSAADKAVAVTQDNLSSLEWHVAPIRDFDSVVLGDRRSHRIEISDRTPLHLGCRSVWR
jgi:hypothetical protein